MKTKRILSFLLMIALLSLSALALADTGDSDACEHSWDEGTVTTPPTCAAEGVMTYTCTLCGATRTEAIARTEHTPVTIPGKAATCTEDGLTEGSKCSVCDAVIQAQEIIPATGHTWSEWTVTQEPTCTDGGTEVRTCSACGAEETRSTEAIGHSWDDGTVTLPATCIAEGEMTYTCARCGATRNETIPRADHTPLAIPGKAATCTETGLTEGSQCSVCGAVLQTQEIIPMIDHTPLVIPGKAATCTETGLTDGSQCSVCGAVLQTQEIIPMIDHTPIAIPGKAATCTETGLTEGSKCAVCGTILQEQQTIPVIKHSPTVIPGKEPACTADGLTDGYKCSACGVILTAQQIIPALGHDWHTTIREPEGITDGESVTTCSRCGETSRVCLPAAPAMFNLLRDTPLISDDSGGLRIVQQPQGGVMPYGGSFDLTVAAEGGLGEYTYEWHCSGGPTTATEDPMSRFAGRVATAKASAYNRYRSAFASAFGSIAKRTYPDLSALEQLSSYTYGSAVYQRAFKLVSYDLHDYVLGTGDSPTYAATVPGTYYCVIRDKAGNRISSGEAVVSCSLYIVSEPRNTNIHGLDSVDLCCVAAGGIPFEDSGSPYMYFWYKAGGTFLNCLSSTVSVSEPGRYYCVVTDANDSTVTSATVTVYDASWLTVTPEADQYMIALSNQTANITMTIDGGELPYTCEWSLDGRTVLDAFTAEEAIVSYPAAELGTYVLTVTDAKGQIGIGASSVKLPMLTVAQQPVGGELKGQKPVDIRIIMADGEAPYTYTLYKNGVPCGSGEGEASFAFQVWEPGEYYIHGEDVSGNYADSDRVMVVADPKPIITGQPESVALEYREDGRYQMILSCRAVSGEGELSALDFCWERNIGGAWYPVGYDHGGSSVFSWAGKDVLGQYRVIVTDPENGESTISDIVTADVPLTCAIGSNGSGRLDGSITGGKAPYTVKVYGRQIAAGDAGGETIQASEGNALLKTVVVFESGPICVDLIRTTEDAAYSIVVEDSLGWSCVSDPYGP